MVPSLPLLSCESSVSEKENPDRKKKKKSTGHQNCLLFVCLTAKADGSKLKPFTMFRNAKRKTKTLNDEFKTRCVIVTSSNG